MGLCGLPSVDIAVYLGQILKNLQKKVLIADLTGSNGLYDLLPASEKLPITYKNVDYIGDRFHIYSSENDYYEYILVCLNQDSRRLTGNRLSKMYYVTNTEYDNFKSMTLSVKNGKMISGVIVRDVTEGEITVSYLLRCIFQDDYLMKMYREHRIFEIHDDLTDREYRLKMQYGNFGEFKNLSPEFCSVLERLSVEITGCKKNYVTKALKYAKEGKSIEKHYILGQQQGKKRDKR